MKFFSRWNRPDDEDRRTALVFGYLRHAPVEVALQPWLEHVTGEPLVPEPLQVSSFWPRVPATDGGFQTEPDLLIDLKSERRCVVVEVKPGLHGHTLGQLRREIVDVAAHRRDLGRPVDRIDAIVVSADPHPPVGMDDWQRALDADPGVTIETHLYHSSFATLARLIRRSATAGGHLATYAADVYHQLARAGLAGYEGAPVITDFDTTTLAGCVEVYNTAVTAARQFFVQLHRHADFTSLGLRSTYTQDRFRMFRDGSSDVVSTDATIRTTTALVTYRRDAWDDRERNQEWVMVAFDLMREQLVVAAALNRWWVIDDLIVRDPQRPAQEPRLASVSTEVDPLLPFSFGGRWCDFRYAERPWRPSDDDGAGDIAFVCQRLHAACQIWDRNA